MNAFDKRINAETGAPLQSLGIEALQLNLGLRCNLACAHCHLDCSPHRTEEMTWPIIERVLEAARAIRPQTIDITGGAPELNPHFQTLIQRLRAEDFAVVVRTNLTVLIEPDHSNLPEFLRDNQVRLVASLPCYLENNVDQQRGANAYRRSIQALKRLNAIGYGQQPALPLDLIFNPPGPALPPDQNALETDYRRKLAQRHGIVFTRLLTIANMPIGRFLTELHAHNREIQYQRLLEDAFNPANVDRLMCRRQISVKWDGAIFDCDFNLALRIPVNHGALDRIDRFNLEQLRSRLIATGPHCFGCTAGQGSSCTGALSQTPEGSWLSS